MKTDLWKGALPAPTLASLRQVDKITVQRQMWCSPNSLLTQSTAGYGDLTSGMSFSFLLKFALSADAPFSYRFPETFTISKA